jgi:lambda repressor-like predicted transcriptional regulator
VASQDDITLAQIQAELRTRGIKVRALSTIHLALHLALRRLGLTRKKRA